MFLVDDLFRKVMDYFFERVSKSRDRHDDGIKNIRTSMRELDASLSEIVEIFDATLHKLKRTTDLEQFQALLSNVVDESFLRDTCNEAGICKGLRIARDELYSLPVTQASVEKAYVDQLADQLEAYEVAFVAAVREFLGDARGIDLCTIILADRIDRQQILSAFEERIDGLRSIRGKIGDLLKKIRER